MKRFLLFTLTAGLLSAPLLFAEIAGSGRNPPEPAWNVGRWQSDYKIFAGTIDATPTLAAVFEAGKVNGDLAFVLPPGTFSIDPQDLLQLPDGATLTGAGMGVTILKLEAGRTGTALRLGNNCTLRDLTIQGNDEAGTRGAGPISAGAVNILCQRVEFKDCEVGLRELGAGIVDGLYVVDCKFTSNTVAGFQTTVAHRNVVVLNPYCDSNGTTGDIVLQGTPVGGIIVGGVFKSTTTHISNTSGRDFYIGGNTFIGGTTPIVLTGIRNTIGPNHVDGSVLDGRALVLNTQNRFEGKYYYSAEPASGDWLTGDIVHDSTPGTLPDSPIAWTASTGGSPGTWQKIYPGVALLAGSITWDPPSLAAGASATQAVTIAGGAVGNTAIATHSQNLPDGFILFAQVTSATNVDVTLANVGGATTDVDSGTLTVRVLQ